MAGGIHNFAYSANCYYKPTYESLHFASLPPIGRNPHDNYFTCNGG